MQFYRRNIDEDIREKERKAITSAGDLDIRVALLQARLRSGFISPAEVQHAAMFDNPAAMRLLDRNPSSLEELVPYMAARNKHFNISVCLNICRNIFDFYYSFMIRGSTESSEERALDVVDDEYRHEVAYFINEPRRALTQIQNYLLNSNTKSELRGACSTLRQIQALVTDVVSGVEMTQQTLWNPSMAGLYALTAIQNTVCACAARKKSAWVEEVRNCINHATQAIINHTGCSQESAFLRLKDTVNKGLFRNI